MSSGANEHLVTYPGFDGADTRGTAYVAIIDRHSAVVGELEDNPGRGVIDAIELIAEGLLDADLVDEPFVLLHYLAKDHVQDGASATWKVEWHARDSDGQAWRGLPTWEPVPPDVESTRVKALQMISAHDEWSIEALEADGLDRLDLLRDADVIAGIQTALSDDSSSYIWNEIAELAYDGGAMYHADSGSVTGVLAVERRARDRWVTEVTVSLDVQRPEGDSAEAEGYRVTLELHGQSPTLPHEVVLIG